MKQENKITYNQINHSDKIINRFRSKIDIPENYIDECWIWLDYKDKNGYGQFSICGKKFRSNRFMYELYYGIIPNKLMVLHTCDNCSCVNPYHLELGNNQDNMNDMVKRERSLKGSKHFNHILEENQVIEIFEGIFNKKLTTVQQISSLYLVKIHTIYKILDGHTWTHISKDYDLNKMKKILIKGY